MTLSTARLAAVVRLELRTQQREPLTLLYVLVLGLLAMAFAAAGPVELVRGRGAVPRDAAWSLWLAATALTAFGQVITTMVAATVVLRDAADRVQELLIITRLSRREYLIGKLAAALIVLCVIYAVIPLGLASGALLAGGQLSDVVRGCLPPFVVLILPTMLAVGALQFAVGVLSGRLWVLVGQGLALIWLWSVCADAASASHAGGVGGVAALLDPFGSAPILHATALWTDVDRVRHAMPLTASLIANRVLWLMVGGGAAALAVWHTPHGARSGATTVMARVDVLPASLADATVPLVVRAGVLSGWHGALAIARYTMRWMLRDTGWRVLALLGMVNVGVHAFVDGGLSRVRGGEAVGLVAAAALQTHARLFLILLATIYAGELVWREREDRSAALLDALPVRDAAIVIGRLAGAIAAQCVLVIMLLCAAAIGAMIGARAGVALVPVLDSVLRTVLATFVLWLLLSLAVHVLVQHKVAAHLCCIAIWVVGVLTAQIAAMPTTAAAASWRWLLWGGFGVLVSWLAWVRGEPGSIAVRYENARRRAEIL